MSGFDPPCICTVVGYLSSPLLSFRYLLESVLVAQNERSRLYALLNICCPWFSDGCMCSTAYNPWPCVQMLRRNVTGSEAAGLCVIRWKTSQASIQRIPGRDSRDE